MNKLTILIITVIFFGFYANPAFAADVLSNSDFFYGETIDNTVEVINASHHQATAGISTQPIELSASEFFYGVSIFNQVEAVRASGLRDRTDVAAQSNSRLAPENFYGYSDVIRVNDKCADC